MRKPFQGVFNIIRFNWHLYLLPVVFVLLLLLLNNFVPVTFQAFITIFCIMVTASVIVSLVVSIYVYDLSGLYELKWLKLDVHASKIVNANAGFDETSILLKTKFPDSELIVFDFYDPATHTEISIERARKAYPQFVGTIPISTSHLPLTDNYADFVFLIFSAHEIRREAERNIFFAELKRILKPSGKIYITEHLRDFPNFLAYNIGVLHFFHKSSWKRTFAKSGFLVEEKIALNPFVTTFILQKNGITS